MSEIGKIELDDDVLDKVSGGVDANSYCPSFAEKFVGAEMKCENCGYWRRGSCQK